MSQHPSTIPTAPQPLPQTPPAPATAHDDEQKIARVQALLRSAHAQVDDESTPHLNWTARDEIARQIHEAINLVRDVYPQQRAS